MLDANQLAKLISFSFQIHETFPKEPKKTVRYWDGKTPYAIHPTWCAMTLLTEVSLPEFIRENGAQALLLHDILEDTTAELPDDCPTIVKSWVSELTFANSTAAWKEIWQRSDEAKLLKLYDATSNLLDNSWLSTEKSLYNIEQVRKLVIFVVATFGELNICSIARAISNKNERECLD